MKMSDPIYVVRPDANGVYTFPARYAAHSVAFLADGTAAVYLPDYPPAKGNPVEQRHLALLQATAMIYCAWYAYCHDPGLAVEDAVEETMRMLAEIERRESAKEGR